MSEELKNSTKFRYGSEVIDPNNIPTTLIHILKIAGLSKIPIQLLLFIRLLAVRCIYFFPTGDDNFEHTRNTQIWYRVQFPLILPIWEYYCPWI